MTQKIVKKLIKILVIIFVVVAVFIIGVRAFFRIPVHSYYKCSEKAFLIPGIKDGFIAQGISYDSEDCYFYITGYMKNGSASPIYILDKESKKLVNVVKMANKDGSDFTGHAGGLSVYDDMIYVAGSEDCCLYGFNKNTVKSAEKNASVAYTSVINLKTNDDGIEVAFTTVHEDILYAGEFYRLPNYPTFESHTVKYPDGENHAIMIGLKKDGEDFVPSIAYSLPGKVQGLCFAQGKIFASTSYATANSLIYVYDESKVTQKGTINLIGKDLPLYVLNDENLLEVKTIAPMSEEIEFVNGKYYIMCESASNKYIFGKFTGAKWCYRSIF